MRMPAAQTLLLFCQDIHTNYNFSRYADLKRDLLLSVAQLTFLYLFTYRIICDSWLQLNFPLALAAETLMIKVAHIHYLWENLLKLRLEGT